MPPLTRPRPLACLLTPRFAVLLLVAPAISLSASLPGVYLSFFLDSAPAPTIVLLMSLCFVVVLLATQRKTVATVLRWVARRTTTKQRLISKTMVGAGALSRKKLR
ncbi:metal ABC transporter permease [Devosia chinhatensis]|uniref:metal ABC transporter permease n=1 Tax=Devosia chinhatensis TaxID=429727 RepID=UPI003CC7A1F2